jgi:hypothetical protein
MTDTDDRRRAVLAAFAGLFGGRSVRHEAAAAFAALAERVPGLTPDELTAAASMVKPLASEMRSVAHMILREQALRELKEAKHRR